MRRATLVGIALALLALGACSPAYLGGSAETLDTPFPAMLTNVHAPDHRHCDDQYGCWIVFDVRVTNPTDRDAQVAQCSVTIGTPDQPRDENWVLTGPPGGTWMNAGSSLRMKDVRAPLLVSYAELAQLPSTFDGSCEGWDWHGHAPD